jgi:hypothetical protein
MMLCQQCCGVQVTRDELRKVDVVPLRATSDLFWLAVSLLAASEDAVIPDGQ